MNMRLEALDLLSLDFFCWDRGVEEDADIWQKQRGKSKGKDHEQDWCFCGILLCPAKHASGRWFTTAVANAVGTSLGCIVLMYLIEIRCELLNEISHDA